MDFINVKLNNEYLKELSNQINCNCKLFSIINKWLDAYCATITKIENNLHIQQNDKNLKSSDEHYTNSSRNMNVLQPRKIRRKE